ncbi:hypothetical protein BGX27_003973 [Mortierella sp. AM989]|nr:hypothetical protein BGX27_003973 [Mortierella sp. AM989]
MEANKIILYKVSVPDEEKTVLESDIEMVPLIPSSMELWKKSGAALPKKTIHVYVKIPQQSAELGFGTIGTVSIRESRHHHHSATPIAILSWTRENIKRSVTALHSFFAGQSSVFTVSIGVLGTGEASKSNTSIQEDVRFRRSAPFPIWDDREKVEAYFNKLGTYHEKQGFSSSASKLRELVDQQVLTLLFARFCGRLRPMVTVIEDVIQHAEVGYWKTAIKEQIARLTHISYKVSGNLCFELKRILDRTSGRKADIREILRNAVKGRLLYFKDYEGYPGPLLDNIAAGSRGSYLDYFSPALLNPTFHEKELNPVLFKVKAKANETPDVLDGRKYSIVGCDTGPRGIHHQRISMSQFLYAHRKANSVYDAKLVPPFFFPPANPSGPDVVFVLESDDNQHYLVFMQGKISGSLEPTDIMVGHETIY